MAEPKWSKAARKIIEEKGTAWQVFLFGQVLSEQRRACEDIRRDVEFGVTQGSQGERESLSRFFDRVPKRLRALNAIIGSFANVVDNALPEALAEPGDAELIEYTARRLGNSYKDAIKWKASVSQLAVEDDLEKLHKDFARLADTSINDMEEFFDRIDHDVSVRIPQALSRNAPLDVNWSVKFREPEVTNELKRRINTMVGDIEKNAETSAHPAEFGCLAVFFALGAIVSTIGLLTMQ